MVTCGTGDLDLDGCSRLWHLLSILSSETMMIDNDNKKKIIRSGKMSAFVTSARSGFMTKWVVTSPKCSWHSLINLELPNPKLWWLHYVVRKLILQDTNFSMIWNLHDANVIVIRVYMHVFRYKIDGCDRNLIPFTPPQRNIWF